MDEATAVRNLLGIGSGGAGGLVGGFLLSKLLANRTDSGSDPVIERLDRTNELLTQLLMDASEIKGILSRND